MAATISSAGGFLQLLRKRLDSNVSWEHKRRLTELLVVGLRQTLWRTMV